jgi:hypothetical protein
MDNRPLNEVLKLAHIPGPRPTHQGSHRRQVEWLNFLRTTEKCAKRVTATIIEVDNVFKRPGLAVPEYGAVSATWRRPFVRHKPTGIF